MFNLAHQEVSSKMKVLIGLLEYNKSKNKIELEYIEFLSKEDIEPRSGYYYKIKIKYKKTIYSPSLIDKNFEFRKNKIIINNGNEKVYFSSGLDNEELIVFEKKIYFHNTKIKLYVAQNFSSKKIVINTFNYFIIFIFILFTIIYSIITFIIINLSLKPLENLSEKINNITHKNLNININNDSNSKELASIINSFNKMLERINNAFETEKNIISDASHKLKTPISVIKSHCEIILQKNREKKEYIESIEIIKHYSEKLSKLISDILSLAYLDSEEISFNKDENISINECINSILEISEYNIKEKNITITFKETDILNIKGDKNKIIELLLIVLENCIKYNKQNGSIDIHLIEENNYIVIIFEDSGIGINKNEISKIFQRFYRSNDVTNIEGSGLGLSIANKIIENYNGKIEVESILGTSTTFKIFLPSKN